MRGVLSALALVAALSLSCFGWGFQTHFDLTLYALTGIAGESVASAVRAHASGPDDDRDSGRCESTPCYSDVSGHRIGEFMLKHEEARYGREFGAEGGARHWLNAARSLYRRGDPTWKRALGWAAHYIADALCPAHCCPPECSWWTSGWPNREQLFEGAFTVAGFVTYVYCLVDATGEFRTVVSAVMTGQPAVVLTGDTIECELIGRAERVARLPIQDSLLWLSAEDLYSVFSEIGALIRGAYEYVTG
jgi:hypothetical protein